MFFGTQSHNLSNTYPGALITKVKNYSTEDIHLVANVLLGFLRSLRGVDFFKSVYLSR